MTPRWLTDLVRIYAICVGGLTLFLFGVILYSLAPYQFVHRHDLDELIVLRRGVAILMLGSLGLFVLGAVMMGCYRRTAKPPALLRRCWWLSLLLAVFTVLFVFPIVQR
jgi:hypothetical protein